MGTSYEDTHHTHDGTGLMTPPTTPQKSHINTRSVLVATRQHKHRRDKHHSAPNKKAAVQEKTMTKKKKKKEPVVGAPCVEPAWKKQKREKKRQKKRERRKQKSKSRAQLVTPSPPRRGETTPKSPWELLSDALPSYSAFFPSANVDGELAIEEQRDRKKPKIQPGDENSRYKHASPALPLPEPSSPITIHYSYDRQLQQHYDVDANLFTPQALASPNVAHHINDTFSFLLTLACEQSRLTLHTIGAEQRIRTLKTKWKIDYPAIHRLEAVMDLESTLCCELMMEEYAFRDVMWENKELGGWDLGWALGALKERVGGKVDVFDREMRKLDEALVK